MYSHLLDAPWIGALLLALTTGPAVAATLTPDRGAWTVTAETYSARFTATGNIASLKVGPEEILVGAPKMAQSGYFYQDGVLTLPQVAQVSPTALEAQCDRASARYEFSDRAMAWTLTNRTAKKMVYVLCLDPEMQAVKCGESWYKPPISRTCTEARWFRGGQVVVTAGISRLWPWVENRQVVEVGLGPNETQQVRFQMGPATPQESEAAANVRAPEPPKDPTGPMWDLKRFEAPPRTYEAPGFQAEGVRALFYEGVPFEGKPTRVFAWLGLPEWKPEEKVPGIVLVHGGGGTAFDNWVRMWTARGYAAIAMDTCGCTAGGTHGNRPRHEFGGPPGWGGFNQIDWEREDQWTFHAIADILLAHSLLRSLPEVDPDRIGVTGISWGGYLTSLVAGVDPRFRFAAPVYGCGHYLDTSFGAAVRNLGGERTERWLRWWDPSMYLRDAKIPMLWVSGSNDFAYWLPALQKSYREAPGPHTLAIRLAMPHGQEQGAAPPEIPVFADSLLRGGDPLPKITAQGRDGHHVWVSFESKVPIQRAELNVTKDTGNWPDRKWVAQPAALDPAGRVTATLPEGARVYYVNLLDARGCVVSSEHEELSGG